MCAPEQKSDLLKMLNWEVKGAPEFTLYENNSLLNFAFLANLFNHYSSQIKGK